MQVLGWGRKSVPGGYLERTSSLLGFVQLEIYIYARKFLLYLKPQPLFSPTGDSRKHRKDQKAFGCVSVAAKEHCVPFGQELLDQELAWTRIMGGNPTAMCRSLAAARIASNR